jgi:hypothetical protein
MEFLIKNKKTVIPHPPYSPDLAPCDFSLFPQLKTYHFDTTEVIKAESQVVLNILTEHNFQDTFKSWQKCFKWCVICVEGATLKVMVASRPKVFDQMETPLLEIMEECGINSKPQ